MTKGSRREREAVELYEDAGYRCYRPETTQYGDNDLWNLFDFAGLYDTKCKVSNRLTFVQVKSNQVRGIGEWITKAAPFVDVLGVDIHYLVCHDYDGWRLAEATVDGEYEWVVDERDVDCTMGERVVSFLR